MLICSRAQKQVQRITHELLTEGKVAKHRRLGGSNSRRMRTVAKAKAASIDVEGLQVALQDAAQVPTGEKGCLSSQWCRRSSRT